MPYIQVLLMAIMLIGCAAKKQLVRNENISGAGDAISLTDTSAAEISNYYLFDYINSLDSDIYFSLLDSIKNGLSGDFFTLRMAFTATENWEPYDTEISDKHKEINRMISESNFTDALKISDSILAKNFVEIGTHMINGYLFKQLGDTLKSQYHYRIVDGLLKSIFESGDGRTARTAFIVISTSEEYSLLKWFNLHSTQQSLVTADDHSFDILKAVDQDTKEEFDIYFNIDLPFSYLSRSFR